MPGPYITQLDNSYVDRSDELKAEANNIAFALSENTQRYWQIPLGGADDQVQLEDDYDYTGKIFELKNLHQPFNRDDLNANYQKLFEIADEEADEPVLNGLMGDGLVVKIQADYLAAQERAFRLRHASPIRCQMHAAGRRDGHADEDWGIFARIDGWLQDLMKQTGADNSQGSSYDPELYS